MCVCVYVCVVNFDLYSVIYHFKCVCEQIALSVVARLGKLSDRILVHAIIEVLI